MSQSQYLYSFFFLPHPILEKSAPRCLGTSLFLPPSSLQIPPLSFYSVLVMLYFQAPAPQVCEGSALPYSAVYPSDCAASPLFDSEISMALLVLASSRTLPTRGHCGFCPITLLKSCLKGHLFVRTTALLSLCCLCPLQY